MTTFAEETGHHLLRSDFFPNNCRWIWLVFENPHGGLLFCFVLIRIEPWFVTCDNLINVFWGTAIVFSQHFYTPIDTNLFFEQRSNCAGSKENKSFLGTQNLMHAGGRYAQGCLYLTVCLMTILHYQFTLGINVIWHNGRFRRTFTAFVFRSKRRPLLH